MPNPDADSIVIVEDDPSMDQALQRILRLGGFATRSYPSAEALLANGALRATCLIVDVQLPGMTGFDLWEHLSRAGVSVPVIFISAYDPVDARARAGRANAAAFLAKPFSGRELLDVVRGALPAKSPGSA